MELVLVLPIFLLLIFSIVEFSMLMSAQTRVASAAQSGARMMSISGASRQEVQDRVKDLLGPALANDCSIEIQTASKPGEVGRVYVRVPMTSASPDLLWMVGFGLSQRSIESDAAMVMERSAAIDSSEVY
jgi:Flp pilus assembly protein TadG